MTPLARTSALLLAVSVVGGCESDAGSPARQNTPDASADAATDSITSADDVAIAATPEVSCQAYCQRTAKLSCGESINDCQDQCLLSRSFAPWCDTAGAASFACLTKLADASFKCDGASPQPITGACGEARNAFQDCVFEGPLPDMTSDCAAYSLMLANAATSLGCGQPVTKEQCLATLMDSLPCNGALAVFVHCVATRQPPSAFQCDQDVVTVASDSPCAPYTLPLGLCVGGS